MKKFKTIVTGVMCCVFLFATTVQAQTYVPKTSWDECPADPNTNAGRFAPLPTFAHNTVCSPVTAWPAVGTYDFCAYMDTVYCQLKIIPGLVPDLAEDVTMYADLLRCLDADINGQVYTEPPAERPVSITVNSAGECTVYWNSIAIFNAVTIPGWSPQANWYLGFGARTGGVNDFHIVDEVDYAGPDMDYFEDFSTGAGLGTLYGNAAILSRQLVLTDKVNDQTGSWSFLPAAAAIDFTLNYNQYIGQGGGADGMCFFYGPGANTAFGEGGPGDTTGLRLTFHTYGEFDNTIRLVYNGSLVATMSPGEIREEGDWLPVTGNGMPDGQWEMRLLGAVLNDPTHPLHTTAHAAIRQNFHEIQCLVQAALASEGYLGIAGLFAKWLVGSLSMTLAGYATLGDPMTYEALNEVIGLLSDLGLQPPPGGIQTITLPLPSLGPYGDAGGDGFTNYEIWDYYVNTMGYTLQQYVQRALLPTKFYIDGLRNYLPGETVELQVVVENLSPETFFWAKDAVPLAETSYFLTIPDAVEEDSGFYSATATHSLYEGGRVATLTSTASIYVGLSSPAVGLAGLVALGGLIGFVGMRRMRRRK